MNLIKQIIKKPITIKINKKFIKIVLNGQLFLNTKMDIIITELKKNWQKAIAMAKFIDEIGELHHIGVKLRKPLYRQ